MPSLGTPCASQARCEADSPTCTAASASQAAVTAITRLYRTRVGENRSGGACMVICGLVARVSLDTLCRQAEQMGGSVRQQKQAETPPPKPRRLSAQLKEAPPPTWGTPSYGSQVARKTRGRHAPGEWKTSKGRGSAVHPMPAMQNAHALSKYHRFLLRPAHTAFTKLQFLSTQ